MGYGGVVGWITTPPHSINFQFPLWDTFTINVLGIYLILSIPFMGYSHFLSTPIYQTFYFQFPLWDT